ncbi:MAG: hypothetical protein ACOC96_07060, partial [Actinomycetota bacterium]
MALFMDAHRQLPEGADGGGRGEGARAAGRRDLRSAGGVRAMARRGVAPVAAGVLAVLVSGCGSEGVVGESADAAGAQESSPAVPADAPSDAASPDVPADVSPDVSADVAAMRAATAQYA